MTDLHLTSSFMAALGTVFTDTLWQGAIIGLSFLTATLFLKTGDARSRYNLAAFALTGFMVWTGVDIYRALNDWHLSGIALIQTTGLKEMTFVPGNATSAHVQVSGSMVETLISGFYNWVGNLYHVIVPLWIGGVFLLSMRLIRGFIVTNRMKHTNLFALPPHWQECANELTGKMKINRNIQLKGSHNITAPMVIGYFSPVILFPLSAVTGLNYSELEAVLAHELAHIRRHDFVFICIQQVAETILFYHPVVWILSSYLDKEREKCCDDVAISLTNNSLPFAKAITLMESQRIQKNIPAASLLGRDNRLLNRIRRILSNGIRHSNIMERTVAAGILIGSLCLLFVFSGFSGNHPESNRNNASGMTTAAPDTLTSITETRTIEAQMTVDSGKPPVTYKMTFVNDSLRDLRVNHKKISRDKFGQYQGQIDEIQHAKNNPGFPDWQGLKGKEEWQKQMEETMQKSRQAMEEAMKNMQMNREKFMQAFNSEEARRHRDEIMNEMRSFREQRMQPDTGAWSGNTPFYGMNEKEMQEFRFHMQQFKQEAMEQMKKMQEEFRENQFMWQDSLQKQIERMQKEFPQGMEGFRNFEMQRNERMFSRPFVLPNPDQKPGDLPKTDTTSMEKTLRSLEEL